MKTSASPGVTTWLVIVVATCIILAVFQKLLWLVVPALLAVVLYYCLKPLVHALVKAGVKPRAAAKAVAGALFFATVLAVVLLLTFAAARAGVWKTTLVRYVQGGLNFAKNSEEILAQKLPVLQQSSLLRESSMNLDTISSEFTEKYLGKILVEALEWLPSLLLMPYLTYFLLQDGNRFKKYLIHSVPNAFFEKTLLLFDRINNSLESYFIGLIKLTFLDTACLGAGLWVIHISSPMLLGFIAAVLAWVPYVGSLVGAILVVFVAATDFPGQPMITYSCILLFLCVRMLDDFIFMPLTIGRGLQIHPVLSVLMLFLGAEVAGPTGLLLVLPVTGVVAVITETLGQIFTDQKLRARYQHARQLKAKLSEI